MDLGSSYLSCYICSAQLLFYFLIIQKQVYVVSNLGQDRHM